MARVCYKWWEIEFDYPDMGYFAVEVYAEGEIINGKFGILWDSIKYKGVCRKKYSSDVYQKVDIDELEEDGPRTGFSKEIFKDLILLSLCKEYNQMPEDWEEME